MKKQLAVKAVRTSLLDLSVQWVPEIKTQESSIRHECNLIWLYLMRSKLSNCPNFKKTEVFPPLTFLWISVANTQGFNVGSVEFQSGWVRAQTKGRHNLISLWRTKRTKEKADCLSNATKTLCKKAEDLRSFK